MLHIILLILKIIGWILLAILGLIVLLICVVLFVPLRYRIEGKCGGDLDSLYGKVKFSWLLSLVGGLLEYQEGKLNWCIRIAWKKIQEDGDDGDEYADEKETMNVAEKEPENSVSQEEKAVDDLDSQSAAEKRESSEMPHSAEPEENVESEEFVSDVRRLEALMKEGGEKLEESLEDSLEIPVEEELSLEEEGQAEESSGLKNQQIVKTPSAENHPEDQKHEKDNQSHSQKEKKTSAGSLSEKKGFFERLSLKIQKLFEKLKYTFEKICDTMKSLAEKKEKVMDFITDEAHRSALAAVLKELKRLLRFLKPKRAEADVEFGFTDPYLTGQTLAALSMVYPFLGEHAEIQPNFEEKILKGDILIAGKIRVVYMIVMLWNLIWNKNVRITIKHVRKFKL